jgi:hypothetical protein
MIENIREGASGLMDRAQDIGESIKDRAGSLREQAGDAAEGIGDRARHVGGAIGERASRLVHEASGIAHRAGDAASEATGRVRGAMSTIGDRAGHLAGSARDTAVQVGQTVGQQAQRLGQTARTTYSDYPLAVGAGVLCLGVLLGLSMPSTPVEDKLMGEASDELAKKARKLGEQALEGGKRVAQAAASAVQEEAGPINADEVIGRVKSVVGTAVNAAKDEAVNQGQKLAGVAEKEGMTDIPKMGFDTGDSGHSGEADQGDEGDRGRGFSEA